jgi:hypothetical protein
MFTGKQLNLACIKILMNYMSKMCKKKNVVNFTTDALTDYIKNVDVWVRKLILMMTL